MAKKPYKPMDRSRIKTGLDGLYADATSQKEKILLAAAERTAIRYYYGMLSATMTHQATGEAFSPPDMNPMRKAVTEINRACANQKKPVLYNRNIADARSLFDFAAGIAPAAV